MHQNALDTEQMKTQHSLYIECIPHSLAVAEKHNAIKWNSLTFERALGGMNTGMRVKG